MIMEIMNSDGTMARLPDLLKFKKKHGLKIPYKVFGFPHKYLDHRAEPRMQSDITARVKSELLRRGVLEAVANPVTALRP